MKFTQAHTTLLGLEIGDPVNLETDIMIRYVSQVLEARELLAEAEGRDAPGIDTIAAWQAYKAKRD